MKHISKSSLRAAADIHRSLKASHQQHAHITLPCETWDLLQQYVRQTKLARKRGWHAAARRFQERIADMLQCLQNLVAEELRMIASDAQSRPIQSQQAIYDDIQALREEFDEVEVDLGGHSLSVTTEPIALEGVSLGRFQIQLDWVELLGAFKTHDLEGLLKYSGFDRQLRSSPDVLESFSRSTKLWSGQDTNGRAAEPTGIRYSLPAEFDKQRADDFFKWLNDPDAGVIPWLRNRID